MTSQVTDHLLMIEPISFGLNPESIEDNFFQPRSSSDTENSRAATKAHEEFTSLVSTLRAAGVRITIYTPTPELRTPDAVFPNNWFSTHEDGVLCLYPMRHPNRRLERRAEIIALLRKSYPRVIDFSGFESRGLFLESTGSMVLDRESRICFAALSQRTSRELVELWCHEMNYTPVCFSASDADAQPIYHTNVVMSVGTKFAVVCPDAVKDPGERKQLLQWLQSTGKTIIPITVSQIYSYCGNCLELSGSQGNLIAMSTQAWNGFSIEQKETLSACAPIIPATVDTIERVGGGSVRCMLAELF